MPELAHGSPIRCHALVIRLFSIQLGLLRLDHVVVIRRTECLLSGRVLSLRLLIPLPRLLDPVLDITLDFLAGIYVVAVLLPAGPLIGSISFADSLGVGNVSIFEA